MGTTEVYALNHGEGYPKIIRSKTPSKIQAHTKIDNQSMLLILADSHGRGLSTLIQEKISMEVHSIVKLGARLSRVIDNMIN